ncbi:hypothetical protein ABL78_3110 [Leptomonas seymouri]|uniref:Uncharacterized protein n=1 Tax=Leptomonas seymouri TaxID=5684 RepID=A0A0N1IL76_LEPSE|nr:hypothetical protein ABL78_3110 [Leptomonas seymouri]|eukprot:KPI87811.1 hypothetical protein ABL78_3110 [Leptomonas seymouri]
MRPITRPSARAVRVGLFTSFVVYPLHQAHRHISIAGGGRGDLFKRHAGQYKAPYGGAARGIRDPSESTEPKDGQLHIRKRRDHIAYDRKYSGGGHHRPAIAAWSYLISSLCKNVQIACPDALYDQLLAGEETLSPSQQQQLTEAQNLFRFELQRRLGLLEDSLAEAELPYLIQWPALFQRVWLRLPLNLSQRVEGASGYRSSSASTAATTSTCPSPLALSSAALPPLAAEVWASPSPCSVPPTTVKAAEKGSTAPAGITDMSFCSRLVRLTRHVVECVNQELKQLEAAAPLREDGAPRSRRQVELEAAWRAQWQSAVQWHSNEPQ